MGTVSQPTTLSQQNLTAFYTLDPSLNGDLILVFYGISTTTNTGGASNSRTQLHVYTPAGLHSYPRLSVSPSSPHYEAVENLQRVDQGDEICRAIAFGLLKFFSEISESAKNAWVDNSLRSTKPASFRLFSAQHAANLAASMSRVEESASLIKAVDAALASRKVPVIDVEVILPAQRSLPIHQTSPYDISTRSANDPDAQYGIYGPLIALFGKSSLCNGASNDSASIHGTTARSTTFSKLQKERIRLQMCELLDTEERYVANLQELITCVGAPDGGSQSRLDNIQSSSMNKLDGLFQPTLNHILRLNSSFLDNIRNILDSTENAAIADIESSPEDPEPWEPNLSSPVSDLTGTWLLAECFLAWMPKFAVDYKTYVQLHAKLNFKLKHLITGGDQGHHQRLQEGGEQRLMSLLIEPVQRLPRYKLYMDILTKNLPYRHPAWQPCTDVSAKITAICSKELYESDTSEIHRLQQLINHWPKQVDCEGTFITAVDVDELQPPYVLEDPGSNGNSLILLLLTGHVILIRKTSPFSIAASDLAMEIKASLAPIDQTRACELEFDSCTRLHAAEFGERNDGMVLSISPANPRTKSKLNGQNSESKPSKVSTRLFHLRGLYRGNAARLAQEIVLARIENRHNSGNRAVGVRDIRTLHSSKKTIGLLSRIYQEGRDDDVLRKPESAPIRIIVDPDRCTGSYEPGSSNRELDVSIISNGDRFYTLECAALGEHRSRDKVTIDLLLPILCKRIESALQLRYQMRNPRAALSLVCHNDAVLKALHARIDKLDVKLARSTRSRAASPVKTLSGIFSGISLKDVSISKKDLPPPPTPIFPPPLLSSTSTPTSAFEPDLAKQHHWEQAKVKFVDKDVVVPSPSAQHLEDTFNGYILSLKARKGNIVGRNVTARGQVEVKQVDELYFTLLQPSPDFELAAQVSVDVLFAAFERFLKVAWRDKMGPIIDMRALLDGHCISESVSSRDFNHSLNAAIGPLTPPNQRAFRSLVILLAELLEFMGNDADKGILTAAMCEMITDSDEAHDLIPLFDYLVEEWNSLGDEYEREVGRSQNISCRATSTQYIMTDGSETSKSSSFGKRLGFGSLHRSNSRVEGGSRVHSVLRQLTGALHSEEPQKQSFPVPTSCEFANQTSPAKQNVLLERAMPLEMPMTSDASSQCTGPLLAQLDLGSPFSSKILPQRRTTPKRKRRSSLSDLDQARQTASETNWTTPTARLQELPPLLPLTVQISPLSSSLRALAPRRKENVSPLNHRSRTGMASKSAHDTNQSDHSTMSKLSESGKGLQSQTLPKMPEMLAATPRQRPILSERPNAGNTSPILMSPTKPGRTTKKSQHSPQKLSERLCEQSQAVANTDSILRDEVQDFGNDLAAANERLSRTSLSNHARKDELLLTNLRTRFTALESRVQHLLGNVQTQIKSLESDYKDVLQTSEKKCRRLDALLTQRDHECAQLYERNNAELMRLFAQLNKGEGVAELQKKLHESLQDGVKWKNECERLKKENATLRAAS